MSYLEVSIDFVLLCHFRADFLHDVVEWHAASDIVVDSDDSRVYSERVHPVTIAKMSLNLCR